MIAERVATDGLHSSASPVAMHIRSASFNSAVLLTAACGLLTIDGGDVADEPTAIPPAEDDPRCSPSFRVPLSMKNDVATSRRLLENGTLLHDGVAYPADSRWTDGNLTYGCICRIRACINKCCRDDEVLRRDDKKRMVCQKVSRDDKLEFAATSGLRLSASLMAKEIQHIGQLKEYFRLVEHFVTCPNRTFTFSPDDHEHDHIVLQADGSVMDDDQRLYPFWDYCVDWQNDIEEHHIGVIVCLNTPNASANKKDTAHHVGIIVSIPFLLATFLVYAIIPELRNLYGKTLMCYVICLITAYVFLILVNYVRLSPIRALCLFSAFIIHFSFLASFFWLNVMCFDIWWTFGGFRSLQGSMKQREQKKFMIYSIYAWGSATILTIVCAIMDFVPSVPKNLIRPEFGTERCWFTTDKAKALYFYGPMSVTVICNICLFISTALKIVRHKKDTAHHLRSSESRRHDDNKQWFSLYLKLFIVMGINWSMEIISWVFKSAPHYVWYLTDLTNTLQGLIIFIIFVWKQKIKRLLLRRFGCQDGNIFSRNSTRSGFHSTASRTCTTTSGVMPLQEKISSYPQTNCRTKSSSDEAEP